MSADERRVLEELLAVVRKNVAAAKPLGTVRIELQIRSDNGDYTASFHIDGRQVRLRYEPCKTPTIIIKVHADDGLALLEGVLNPRAALTDGRLRISGDVALATKLAPLFV